MKKADKGEQQAQREVVKLEEVEEEEEENRGKDADSKADKPKCKNKRWGRGTLGATPQEVRCLERRLQNGTHHTFAASCYTPAALQTMNVVTCAAMTVQDGTRLPKVMDCHDASIACSGLIKKGAPQQLFSRGYTYRTPAM